MIYFEKKKKKKKKKEEKSKNTFHARQENYFRCNLENP